MSSDVLVLLAVLFIFFVIFRRLNREKPRTESVKLVSGSTLDPATRQAIAARRKNTQTKAPIPAQKCHQPDLGHSSNLSPRRIEDNDLPQVLSEFNLQSYSDVDAALAAEIEQMIATFVKPHPLLNRLASNNVDHNELAELIKSDADIAAKILTVVNSAKFSLQQPIKDINHAIIFLGSTQVKTIALQFAMQNGIELKHAAQNKAYQKIWSVSYLASQLAFLLAKSLGKENAAELSTQCLLLYLGDLVLLSEKPELAQSYLSSQPFTERLNDIQHRSSTNAGIVGYMLAKHWQLPETMVNAMRDQYLPLTNKLADYQVDSDAAKDLMLCYIVCRISDMVVFEGKSDILSIAELSYPVSGKAEFFYLNQLISEQRLDQINQELHANNFVYKAKDVIARALATG